MYYRDTKLKFKPNPNFQTSQGFLYSYLDDKDNFFTQVVYVYEHRDKQLPIRQLYNKYNHVVDNKDIAILQYYDIADDGQDSELHVSIVQQELKQIKEKFFTKKEETQNKKEKNDNNTK